MKSKDLENGEPIDVDEIHCRAPITHLRIQKFGGHIHVSIWINHGNSGELVLREGTEFDYFIPLLLESIPTTYCFNLHSFAV